MCDKVIDKKSVKLSKYCCDECAPKLLKNTEKWQINWIMCEECKDKFISCHCGSFILKDGRTKEEIYKEHVKTERHILIAEKQDKANLRSELFHKVLANDRYHPVITTNKKYSFNNRLKYVFEKNGV
jgi:hypothetical protein